MTTGDLDGDGYEDIVAAAYTGTTIAWWRSLGDGTFSRYDIAVSVADIIDVEVADINGDGNADVVVTSADNTDAVGWFENDGTPLVGSWPLRLIALPFDGAAGTAVGDIDQDGTLDVAAVAASAHLVSVALNINGTGVGWSYETVDPSFSGARWVSLGDLDNNGNLDVAAAAYSSGEVSWWSRDAGGGTWTEHSITTVASANIVELVDLDLDGDLDALGAGASSSIRWWENNGAGGGWAEHTVADPVGDVLAAYPVDLDLDGDPDVIYAVDGADGVGWYENTVGDALTWEKRLVDGSFDTATDVAAADFNLDGDPDLVAVEVLENDLSVWDNLFLHRSATYPQSTLVTATANHVKGLESADLDDDGDLDLLAAEFTNERVAFWGECER